MGRRQDGRFRVEIDDSKWFGYYIIYDIRRGPNQPIESIKGIDEAFTRCRQLNRGSKPRYEVREGSHFDCIHYNVVDMWDPWDYFGKEVYTCYDKKEAEGKCKALNAKVEPFKAPRVSAEKLKKFDPIFFANTEELTMKEAAKKLAEWLSWEYSKRSIGTKKLKAEFPYLYEKILDIFMENG